jgi:hypothetical protein
LSSAEESLHNGYGGFGKGALDSGRDSRRGSNFR